NVHDAPPARVAPVSVIEFEPAVAPIAPPPQLPTTLAGVDTSSPAGRGSVNAIPLALPAFELLMVKLSAIEPFSGIVGAPKLLLIDTGTTARSDTVLLTEPADDLFAETAPVVFVFV